MHDSGALGCNDRSADCARTSKQRNCKRHDTSYISFLQFMRLRFRLAHSAGLGVKHRECHQQKDESASDAERRQARSNDVQERLAQECRSRKH